MKKIISIALMLVLFTVCMTSNVSAATKLQDGSYTVQTKPDASYNYFTMSIIVKSNKITKASFKFMNQALGSEVTSDLLSIIPKDQQTTFKQILKDVKYYNDQISKKKNAASVIKSKKDKSGIYKQFQSLWKQVLKKASKTNTSTTQTPTPVPVKCVDGTYIEKTAPDTSYNYFQMSITVKDGLITTASFQFMNDALGSEVTADLLSIIPEDQQDTFKQMMADVKSYNDQFAKLKNGESVNKDKKDKTGIYDQFQSLWKKIIEKAGAK